MTTAAKKIKTTASVFELPQRLGILQYVEYEPPPREWCTEDGCHAFCAQDGAMREARLELEFSRYETYEGEVREVYRLED